MWTMNDTEKITISRLQERAEKCRRLARQATSEAIAVELEKLARDYDEDLARLEYRFPDRAGSLTQ